MLKKLYPVLFFGLVTVLAFWKVIFHPEFTLLTGGDMCSMFYPWFNIAAYWLKKGVLLLWDPYVFSGKPTLGEVQPGLLYPLNWLFMLLPSKTNGMDMQYLEVLLILNYFLAGYFCFLLGRSFNLSFLGSAAAGIVFAFGGFLNQLYGYGNVLQGFVHLPLLFYLFHESIKSQNWASRIKWAMFSALSLALSFLAGHHAPPIQSAFLLVLFVIFLSIRNWRVKERLNALKPAILLCFIFLVAFFLTAAQWMPAMEYAHQAYRWIGTEHPIQWGENIPYSVLQETGNTTPQNLVSLLLPYVGTGINLYVGPAVLFLALIALLKVHKSEVYFFAVTFVLYLFLSFGTFSVIHGWVNTFVPGLWFSREAFYFLLPFQLSLALLAGFGLDYLISQDSKNNEFRVFIRRMQWLVIFSVIFCSGMIAILHFVRDAPMQNLIHTSLATLAIYSFFLSVLIFLFREGRIKTVVFGSLLVLLLFIDLSSNISAGIRTKSQVRGEENPSVQAYWTKPKAITFLQSLRQKEYFRVDNLSGTFPENFGDVWQIEETHGHGATMLVTYFNFRSAGWETFSNTNALLNARYFTGSNKPPLTQEIFHDDVSIYANPRAVPRAFFPSRYRTFENEQQILEWISSPLFTPDETILLLKSDLSILPKSFVDQLTNENDDISYQMLSIQRGEEKFIWGWNAEDQLTLAITPRIPVEHSFLILNYYPLDSRGCNINLNFRNEHQSKEMKLMLQGINENEIQWTRKNIYFDLGSLTVDRSELTISKSADCAANIDSVRVSSNQVSHQQGVASIVQYEPNHLIVNADVKKSSLLVLSEMYYPGWRAWVDSKRVQLLRGNSILRVIPVQKGKHKVELKFQPESFRWGAVISLMSLLLIAIFLVKKIL